MTDPGLVMDALEYHDPELLTVSSNYAKLPRRDVVITPRRGESRCVLILTDYATECDRRLFVVEGVGRDHVLAEDSRHLAIISRWAGLDPEAYFLYLNEIWDLE